jgi:hypothetical protein
MSVVTKNLKQKGTYWAPGAPDGFGGLAFSAPVSIKLRWEDVQELFITAGGEEVRSEAKVFVDRDLVIGGMLYLGTSAATNPTTLPSAKEVRGWKKIPSLSATEFFRTAFL